jgi:hypothetical protein
MGITVTQSYSIEYTHAIIEDLISKYCSTNITTSNIDTTEATDKLVTLNWYQKPFWECILELCNRSGYDSYIDSSFDFHYFVSGSINNTTECVVHEQNLIETGEFAPDLSVLKNRIIVYGAKIEQQQILWTEEDDTSIASYDVKELIVNDANITTVAQAKARAEYELSLYKDPPTIGEVTSLGLPTLSPGEKLRISDPINNLTPGYYTIQKFTHKFDNDNPMMTVLTVQEETSTLPKILKKRITFETQTSEMENPYEMRYSWLFDFIVDSGTHSTTEITGGVLKTTAGNATGTWISDVNTLSENALSCELRAKVNSIGSVYYVSTDDGANWQSITLNTLLNLSPPGTNLKIKVELNAEATEIDSICLLFKT